jgi:hypothetical protein
VALGSCPTGRGSSDVLSQETSGEFYVSTRNPDLVHCIGGQTSVTFRSGSSLALDRVRRTLALCATKLNGLTIGDPRQFLMSPRYETSFENTKFGPWMVYYTALLPEEILLMQKIFKDNTPPENLGEISNYR